MVVTNALKSFWVIKHVTAQLKTKVSEIASISINAQMPPQL
jgi:hypothetical protein